MAQGKVKKLDGFYMCRQGGNSTPYARTTMAQQMFDSRFSDRYLRFKRCLMRYLSETPLDDTQLSEAVNVVFGHFLGTWLQTSYLQKQLTAIQRSVKEGSVQTDRSLAPFAGTGPKDFLFYVKRLRQALRHPRSLVPKSYERYSSAYAPVLDFLHAYLHNPEQIGLDLKISDSAAKR
jgi:hypothetical protein